MSIHEKLMQIQQKLKAPKGQHNSFGNYNYRSAEDILEAVKPLLYEQECTLTLSDDIVVVGDRFYIKTTATLTDTEGKGDHIQVTALAREALQKKGMDDSQITGTASSYARKYALNGLFAIDDTKDADTDEYRGKPTNNTIAVCKAIAADAQKHGISPNDLTKIVQLKYGKKNSLDCTEHELDDLKGNYVRYFKELQEVGNEGN